MAGLAAAIACGRPALAQKGPDADLYGAREGYPVPPTAIAQQEGNPWQPKYRVGAFTHLDAIYRTRTVRRSATPWLFRRPAPLPPPDFVTGYLSRNPVTGLLLARDDQILIEQYQYDRTDRDRFVSQSMVKSITGLLVGLAISEGAIASVNDPPEKYVAGFRGSEYGGTPIRALLHMSSGVDFGEARENNRDLNRLWRDMVAGVSKKGTIGSIVQFNRRIAPPGTRYRYASIEPDVLGVVLRQATGKPMSDYLQEKVWGPIGAEADATWLIDAEGFELAHFGLSAVLRDYARLGRLLAHDGAWNGRQILSARWMNEATTVRASDAYLAPGNAMKDFGYGYLLWLLPGARRQFAMVGAFGQRIVVDPPSKLVMVQTALDDRGESWKLWRELVGRFG
jgi:CubicO group peptidase (beta-lactamase class C family)